ncbi:MAG: T9SS type A sorting domain-containing protein [Bacteroidetes bacterium]|jgi:hypothetical protein|nr:T9SS type A sorting domain-containing protein [Bacteroidota bacterium]
MGDPSALYCFKNVTVVSTLVNESVTAGTHTVNFDASSLSSGVYIYKLQTGSAFLTRKLTLIK